MEITMKKTTAYAFMAAISLMATTTLFTSCDKVSPTGVLIGNTSVDDRVKQSLANYAVFDMAWDKTLPDSIEEYSFIVGSDSHITYDPGRLSEMLEIGIEHGDLFYCHLGDLADTKAEYYENTALALYRATQDWWDKYLEPYINENFPSDSIFIDKRTGDLYKQSDLLNMPTYLPFYPVVGNHDITHNGWALYCNLFRSSFYEFTVQMGNSEKYDRFIFLDSANGTLGQFQIEQLDNGILQRDKKEIRNTFVFTHTNIFRPSLNEFASTYCREELYYILDKLADWNTTIMFYGHVHAWDDRMFGGVRHITMPSMNFVDHPNGGDDLLVRITVMKDGSYKMEHIGLHCKERSKEELKELGYYTNTI